ncbi:zinc-ribbon domain-containing protein [Lactococcus petauri]|jgi:RNA polymerase subunit RPABC4/transcription elongation factor Spt4|uniref:Zinc ribbon domain-containing protein n=1 Tax=Lactococcus petauri TaxID=1940789 RepID=A0A252CAM6_9LACT|nr:zinc ribbon domain-containing protein [Lactococcus petauri]OUK02866.1 zinc ribbon domain-containing protein [Lactococcus petauri]
MENKKNSCTNCGEQLNESSVFCPHCGTKQTIVEETSTITSEPQNSSMSNFKDKVKNIMRKYHLIPSDIIAIVGAIITLLGVYVFKFFDITIPFLGHQSSTLAGSVKFIKQFLGLGESLRSGSSVSGEVSSMIHQLQFFIAAMTILPLVVIVCTFINKKISKIISGVAALLVTILYFIFNAKVQSAIASNSSSKDLINSLFGPAGMIIIIGLLVMLGGACYTLYLFLKKSDEKINLDLSKVTKKQWMIGGGIAALILAMFGIFAIVNSMQKSVIKDVKVEFSGYDHQGEARLSGNYDEKIADIMSKKTDMSPSDISVNLDKTSGLSNGDKVTVTISSELKKSPVKSETKTFTVSGLKKSTSYTVDSLLKSIKYNGFNHYGTVDYDENMFSTTDDTSKLSNGDKITLELSDSYIEQEASNGKVLEGSKSKTVEVSGLKDSVQLSNLDELLTQTDSVARDDNKSNSWSTYTVTRQDSYFVGKNITNSWFSDDSDTAGQFSILTIYKVDEKSDNRTEPSKYKVYGYSGLTLKGDKVDVSSLTSDNKYSNYQSFNSVQEVLDSLKTDYPSISKMK